MNKEQYEICKERGHSSNGQISRDAGIHSVSWYRCKFCYVSYRIKEVLVESIDGEQRDITPSWP